MMYNDALEYSLSQICEHTKLAKDQIVPYLQSIVKVELLKVAGNDASELDENSPDDVKLALNTSFSK